MLGNSVRGPTGRQREFPGTRDLHALVLGGAFKILREMTLTFDLVSTRSLTARRYPVLSLISPSTFSSSDKVHCTVSMDCFNQFIWRARSIFSSDHVKDVDSQRGLNQSH